MTHSMSPIASVLSVPDSAALAGIVGIEGPSYRPLGAMMAVLSELDRVGTLSSGCIESDIAPHAMKTISQGSPRPFATGADRNMLTSSRPAVAGWIF